MGRLGLGTAVSGFISTVILMSMVCGAGSRSQIVSRTVCIEARMTGKRGVSFVHTAMTGLWAATNGARDYPYFLVEDDSAAELFRRSNRRGAFRSSSVRLSKAVLTVSVRAWRWLGNLTHGAK